jgi:hypothetical protein
MKQRIKKEDKSVASNIVAYKSMAGLAAKRSADINANQLLVILDSQKNIVMQIRP